MRALGSLPPPAGGRRRRGQGGTEARARGRRHRRPRPAHAQEADTAGPAGHAVDHCVQRTPPHEAAVRGRVGVGGRCAWASSRSPSRRPSTLLNRHYLPLPASRYHYNVANNRVQQHVEKGNDDGLYISSVACCQDLWALIMDAGTGFAQQVYDLSNQVRRRRGVGGAGGAAWVARGPGRRPRRPASSSPPPVFN